MARRFGTLGNDTLNNGTSGDDQFFTGAGHDTVQGSAGNDSYNLGFAGSASYWRFGFHDSDTLDYRGLWTSAGAASNNAVRIEADLALGQISKYGSTGALLGRDTVIGVDNLVGTAGDDVLKGRSNWDFEDFRGSAGNDQIDGRGGEDQANYSDAAQSGIRVNMAAGTVSSSDALVGSDTLREIEDVVGTRLDDVYVATGYTGSSVNRNSFGQEWNVFTPNGGNDRVTGNGQTILSFGGVGGALTVNLGLQTSLSTEAAIITGFTDDPDTNGPGPGTLTASGVYTIIGTPYGDTLLGGGRVNTVGFPQAQTLSGDTSFESFRGSGGDDHIDGKSGYDRADYRHKVDLSQGLSVNLAAGTATGDPILVGTDTLRGIESIRSSLLDDVFNAVGYTLSNAASPSVNSGDMLAYLPTGATLASRAFNEFNVAGGHDTVTGNGATRIGFDGLFVESRTGTVVNVSFSAEGAGHADFGVSDGGFGSVDFTGTFSIRGSTGNDVMTGGAGYQFLQGWYGNDTLRGGDGVDVLYGHNGGDLTANNPNPAYYSDDDTLDGGAGNDLLYGDFGNDVLVGGTGNDQLFGGTGDDRLDGGAGNDTVHGGVGIDRLTGGSGTDNFIFSTRLNGPPHADVITDFSPADDTLWLKTDSFVGIGAAGTLAADAFVTGTAAQDASDRIVYNSASGAIYFDADGNGSGGAVLFATVTAGTALTASDFWIF